MMDSSKHDKLDFHLDVTAPEMKSKTSKEINHLNPNDSMHMEGDMRKIGAAISVCG